MSIGKNSISRLTHAAKPQEGGIRSLAPEVPADDAATPAPFAVTEELTVAPATEAAAEKAAPAEKKKPGRKPKTATVGTPKAAKADSSVQKKKPGRKPKAVTEAVTADAHKTAKAAPVRKTAPKAPKAKGGFVTVSVGEALPYWLL